MFIVFSDWLSVLEEPFIRVLRSSTVCSGRVWGLKLRLSILEERQRKCVEGEAGETKLKKIGQDVDVQDFQAVTIYKLADSGHDPRWETIGWKVYGI